MTIRSLFILTESAKRIVLTGASFDENTRTITDWKAEALKK